MKIYLLVLLAFQGCAFPVFAAPLKLKATYVVPPVQNAVTSEASRRFEVTYWIVQNSDGTDSALFTLPRELTGKKISTELKVISQSNVDGVVRKTLEGPLGRAECVGPWKVTQCQYQFKNLNIHENDVEKFLAKKFGLGTPEFLEALKNAKIFKCDPIGEILTPDKTASLAPILNCAN